MAALAMATVAFAVVPVAAQQESATQQERPQVENQTQAEDAAGQQTAQAAASRKSFVFRATDLEEMMVRDEQGRDFGEIEEFVVDWNQGRVPYVVVSTGGFLEIGEKLFVMPLAALEYQKKVQDQESEQFLQSRMSQERLIEAPSFEKNSWPTLDAQWQQRINSFYNVQGTEAAAYRPQRNAAEPKQEVTTESRKSNLHRSSALVGMNVHNTAGEEIGEINDLVIDIGKGELRYAALSFGGFLGVGDKLYAIPHQAMKLTHDPESEENHFVLNVSQEKLEKAPGFSKDNWPSVADPKWSAAIDKHYEVKPKPEATQPNETPRQP